YLLPVPQRDPQRNRGRPRELRPDVPGRAHRHRVRWRRRACGGMRPHLDGRRPVVGGLAPSAAAARRAPGPRGSDARRGQSPRADSVVRGPETDAPADIRTLHEQGADFWTLALTRELDDLIRDLRTNETELGTWVLQTEGEPARVLGYDRLLTEHGGDWLVNE